MYQQKPPQDDWFGIVWSIILAILTWLYFIAIGAWWVSMWLTKKLIKGLDLLTEGLFDKEDGLVVLVPTLIWPGGWLWLFYWLVAPELQNALPAEYNQTLWGFVAIGVAWGLSIGTFILLTDFQGLEEAQPVYQSEQTLGEPIRLNAGAGANAQPSLPPKQQLEQELEEVFRRVDQEKETATAAI